MPKKKAIPPLSETVGNFFGRERLDPENGILIALS